MSYKLFKMCAMHGEAGFWLDKLIVSESLFKEGCRHMYTNIINISQSIAAKFKGQDVSAAAYQENERRVHADRRKEPRFGDVIDRRKK